MQLYTSDTEPAGFQPVSVTLTIESPDELRWLYHVANQQATEIEKGYCGNRKGSFDDRFVPFTAPDKKELLRFVRDTANQQGVVIHQ